MRTAIGEAAFADWGWRIPFLVSIILLGISVWIRLTMNESPAFQKMKDEGKTSKAPLTESFGERKNLKIVILVLVGLTAGQAVIWYTGQFCALFFMTGALEVDNATANILIAISLVIGTPFFIVSGALSDKIGRKMIIMAGCLLGVLTYLPVFSMLTQAANPDLAAAQAKNKVVVTADPGECSFQFNPTGVAKFASSCNLSKQKLVASSESYENATAVPGTPATIKVGDIVITSYSVDKIGEGDIAAAKEAATKKVDDLKAAAKPEAEIKAATDALAAFTKDAKAATVKSKDAVMVGAVGGALRAAGYPTKADPAKMNKPMIVAILVYLMILVTMLYFPIAAMLV